MKYEKLLNEIDKNGLQLYELPMHNDVKGLCIGKNIIINKTIESNTEKSCVLAEEIGHYITTVGNITEGNDIACAKQELKARAYAYDALIGLDGIADALKAGSRNFAEAAEYLCVTEDFFNDAIKYYMGKYGVSTFYKDMEIIFMPSLQLKSVKNNKNCI